MAGDAIMVYKLHAELKEFKAKVQRSLLLIQKAVARSKRPYVACSWGKDSICLLHLVASQRPGVDVIYVHCGEYDDWPGTEELMEKYKAMLPITVHVAEAMSVVETYRLVGHFYVFPSTPAERAADAAYNRAFFRAIIGKARELGCDLAFIGLTKEESKIRRRLLERRGALFYSRTHKMWECFPLADWTGRDVWAYIFAHNLPYLELYDLAPDREKARNGAMFAATIRGGGYFGQLALLKRMYPELFNRFAAEFPEVRCYV